MFMKKHLLLFTAIFTGAIALAQNFPAKEWKTPSHDKPLIFYISGDGGLNKFSTAMCESLNKKGYDVTALNARSYFDDKKTPEQTAEDIKNYLLRKTSGRKNKEVVLIGYSFGADVLPFVLNRLPKNLLNNIKASFIMASSGNTDFEIHWADLFGKGKKREMDVVSEINKLTVDNLVIINASDEQDLAVNKINLKKYSHEVLPGGHHFDGDTEEITEVIMNHID